MENENQEVTNEVENVEQVTNVDETEVNNEVEFTDTSVNASNDTEVEEKSQLKTLTQKEIDDIVQERLIRERKKYEREKRQFEQEILPYKALAQTLQAGTGATDINSVLQITKQHYKEQGLEIPEDKPFTSERDEIILAKADAEEIIDLGLEEMEAEANKLASIPRERRSLRENTMFNTLCEKLVVMKSEQELERKGIDKSILNNDEFKKFASKFTPSTPITEIHELYSQKTKVLEKPKSTGSVKTVPNESGIKEFYTPEEAKTLTWKDLDDPRIMAAVDRSRTMWK